MVAQEWRLQAEDPVVGHQEGAAEEHQQTMEEAHRLVGDRLEEARPPDPEDPSSVGCPHEACSPRRSLGQTCPEQVSVPCYSSSFRCWEGQGSAWTEGPVVAAQSATCPMPPLVQAGVRQAEARPWPFSTWQQALAAADQST